MAQSAAVTIHWAGQTSWKTLTSVRMVHVLGSLCRAVRPVYTDMSHLTYGATRLGMKKSPPPPQLAAGAPAPPPAAASAASTSDTGPPAGPAPATGAAAGCGLLAGKSTSGCRFHM